MIYHIWREFPPRDEDEKFRNALAQSSWTMGGRIAVPVRDSDLPRMYDENGSSLPYVRDVFDFGVKGLPDDAMAMVTCSDVGLAGDALVRIEQTLSTQPAGDCLRHVLDAGRTTLPDAKAIADGSIDGGKGVWFFKVGWWRSAREAFPDMLLPRAAWDLVVYILLTESAGPNYVQLPYLCWHVPHTFHYHGLEKHGNKHNLTLCRKFLHEHNASHFERICYPEFFGLDWSTPYTP